jgi:hypothetical protein
LPWSPRDFNSSMICDLSISMTKAYPHAGRTTG